MRHLRAHCRLVLECRDLPGAEPRIGRETALEVPVVRRADSWARQRPGALLAAPEGSLPELPLADLRALRPRGADRRGAVRRSCGTARLQLGSAGDARSAGESAGARLHRPRAHAAPQEDRLPELVDGRRTTGARGHNDWRVGPARRGGDLCGRVVFGLLRHELRQPAGAGLRRRTSSRDARPRTWMARVALRRARLLFGQPHRCSDRDDAHRHEAHEPQPAGSLRRLPGHGHGVRNLCGARTTGAVQVVTNRGLHRKSVGDLATSVAGRLT